jgi:hypothetical protein
MPAHSRLKNGVASLAYVAGIHFLKTCVKHVGGRNRSGHKGPSRFCSQFKTAFCTNSPSKIADFGGNGSFASPISASPSAILP